MLGWKHFLFSCNIIRNMLWIQLASWFIAKTRQNICSPPPTRQSYQNRQAVKTWHLHTSLQLQLHNIPVIIQAQVPLWGVYQHCTVLWVLHSTTNYWIPIHRIPTPLWTDPRENDSWKQKVGGAHYFVSYTHLHDNEAEIPSAAASLASLRL